MLRDGVMLLLLAASAAAIVIANLAEPKDDSWSNEDVPSMWRVALPTPFAHQ